MPTATDRIATALATGLGAGLAPKAPGTLGSLEGVALFLALSAVLRGPLQQTPVRAIVFLTAVNLVVFFVGVWSATRVCRITKLEDPQKVVADEVSGQLISLSPLAAAPTVTGVIVGFALFRILDIFKPYPINRMEQLHGGLGVMADDALAGVFAAALVWLGRYAGLL